jgi:DNA-binding CsgD family transcriptional regulator
VRAVEPTIVAVGWAASDVASAFPGAREVVLVESSDQVEQAVGLATAGDVVIMVPTESSVLEALVADLRRLGPVRIVRQSPADDVGGTPLSAEAGLLLDLLADGLTLGAAAEQLQISRRTADRRLAQARRILGASSTAEAVAASRHGGRQPLPRSVPGVGRGLVGRDAELARIGELMAIDGSALLVGEGGVGKSALIAAAVPADGRPVWSASALAVMRIRRFWPLTEALGGVELAGDVEAVAAQVEALVGPDLLVVDDVHLADGATVEVLCALTGRVALLLAARPDPAGADGPVERLTRGGFVAMPVAPLADEEAAELALALAPGLARRRVHEVVAGSGGLPLLVEFLSGRDPDAPLGRDLAPDVRALSRSEFIAALRLALSGAPLPRDASTDALLAAGVAAARPEGMVSIRHALVSETVVGAADPADVVAVHRALASATGDLGVAAQHWRAAGEIDRAMAAAQGAAGRARSASDRARLLALAAECAPDDQREQCVLEAAAALSAAGMHAEVSAALDAPGVVLTDGAARARAWLLRARAQWHAGDSSLAADSVRAGLALVDDTGPGVDPTTEAGLLLERVRCEALSSGLTPEHDSDLARAADLIGDGPGRAALLSVLGIVEYLRAGTVGAWEDGRAAALAEGDVDSLMRCSNNVIMWNESVGDPEVGLALALEMADEADRRGLVEWRSQFQAMAANLLYHRGRYDQVLPVLEVVESDALDLRTRRQAHVCHASLLIDLGMLDAAAGVVPPRPSPDEPDWMHDDSVHYLHAALAQAAGRPREALSIMRELSERGAPGGDILAFLAPVRAWAEHDLGLPISPVADASHLPVVQGLILEARGVALLADDPGAAAEVLSRAAAVGSAWTHGPSLRARWGAAEAQRLAGRQEAVAALLAVEEEVVAAGLEPLLARVHRSLRLAGITRSAQREMDRSGLLTARERQVLDLVAGGASYAEIARRLGVGRPTVRRLLDNARAKLGAGNRLGAVAALSGA